MFDFFKKKPPPSPVPQKRFPPVPDWQPSIKQPIERVVERGRFYTNGTKDLAVFAHGTLVALPDGLSDADAVVHALNALRSVFHAHPDMNPSLMKDGNILVRYNNDAVNIVLADVVEANWPEIERQHLHALATEEVLITSFGPNKLDEFGKKALFGRCYMFMDAQDPKVIGIERKPGDLGSQ